MTPLTELEAKRSGLKWAAVSSQAMRGGRAEETGTAVAEQAAQTAEAILALPDSAFEGTWRTLTDEQRSAIGSRGFDRFQKLTPHIAASVERARRETEREHANLSKAAEQQDGPAVQILRGSDITPEPINWLWDGWIAGGKFHMLAGAPGTGKTTLALSVAATLSTGGRWPDGSRTEAGNVLIWSGEDDPADTLAPRLIASGADMSRIYFLSSVTQADGKTRCFDPATDIQELRAKLAELGAVSLVIVDPVVNAVTGDGHSNPQVRRSLQPLVDLGGGIGCAVLGITHLSKGTEGRDPVERLNGSIAFGALPRVVMLAFKRSEDDGGGRAVVRAKSNIGPDSGGFMYDLHQSELENRPGLVASHVLWGDPLEGTARELLATAEVVAEGDERSGTEEAVDLLRELLSAEPMHAKAATGKLRQSGYSDKQIRRARERLGVQSVKQGFGAEAFTVWKLPHTCPPSPNLPKDAPLSEVASRASMGKCEAESINRPGTAGDGPKPDDGPGEADEELL